MDDKKSMQSYPAYEVVMLVLFYSIVLVGGDGSYHQTVNALQRRLLKEAGLDENDPATDLLCAPFPMGVIPAGLFVLIDLSLTVKVATVIFLSGRGQLFYLLRKGN